MSGTPIEAIAAILMLVGACLTLVAALGMFRLPDLFTRMHASSKAGTAGSGLLLLSVALQSGETGVWIKCLLAILFFFLTAPVSAHMLARAAVRAGQALPSPEGANRADPNHDRSVTGEVDEQ